MGGNHAIAVTFLGSAASFVINGNDLLTQPILTIENAPWSRVTVTIKRLAVQNDAVNVLTSVMPLIKSSRATSIPSGGITLAKCAFDPSQTSHPAVTVRAAIASGNPITVTPGNSVWQQFSQRMHTGAEQQLGNDANALPWIVEKAGYGYFIRPGESLSVLVAGATVLSNAAVTNNFIGQIVWQEDSIATFAISGTVTLSAVPVSGAKVIVMEATDESMSNPVLVEVLTTNGLGQWASSITSGRVGAAFVQYKNGATYYTAPGSPFLE